MKKKDRYEATTELGAIVGAVGEGVSGCFTCGLVTILILATMLVGSFVYIWHTMK